MANLVIKNLSRTYTNHFVAMKDFNLEAADGELITIVGPKESGKSVLLHMIAGLEQPSRGEIWIDNEMVNDLEPKDRDIAMIFRNFALYPDKTVYENLAFGLQMRKYSKLRIQDEVMQVVNQLDMQEILHKKPGDLSMKDTLKTVLGRALVRNPKVILMDDALENLEEQYQKMVQEDMISLIKKLGITIVFATEDPELALLLGDQVVVVKEGQTLQAGTPEEVFKHPANMAVAGILMRPSMNFAEVLVMEEEDELCLHMGKYPVPIQGEAAAFLRENGYIGKHVMIGMHESDIQIEKLTEGREGHSMVAEVKKIRMYHGQPYAYFDLGSAAFAVKAEGIQAEDLVACQIQLNQITIFDKDTGETIYFA